MVNVAVGVLAALISVVTLLITTIFHKLCETIAALCVRTRLISHSHAPFVTADDLWLPNAVSSLFKFRRHPGVLLTICLSTLLVISELLLELGVDVTNNCVPTSTYGTIIKNGIVNRPTDVELSPLSFMLQQVQFRDGDFTHISAGFPRHVTDALCISCLPPPEDKTVIASNCTVTEIATYPAGAVSLGVETTDGSFGTVATGVTVMNENRIIESYNNGSGDLTLNDKYAFIFVQSPWNDTWKFNQSNGIPFDYWEYTNYTHLNLLFNQSKKTENVIFNNFSTGPVHRSRIKCDINHLPPNFFQRALLVYRSIQVENVVRPAEYNSTSGRFPLLTRSDVYRAVLAMKAAEDVKGQGLLPKGVYYEYPQCATYYLIYAMPTVVALSSIVALGIVAAVAKRRLVRREDAVRREQQEEEEKRKKEEELMDVKVVGDGNDNVEAFRHRRDGDDHGTKMETDEFRSTIDRDNSSVNGRLMRKKTERDTTAEWDTFRTNVNDNNNSAWSWTCLNCITPHNNNNNNNRNTNDINDRFLGRRRRRHRTATTRRRPRHSSAASASVSEAIKQALRMLRDGESLIPGVALPVSSHNSTAADGGGHHTDHVNRTGNGNANGNRTRPYSGERNCSNTTTTTATATAATATAAAAAAAAVVPDDSTETQFLPRLLPENEVAVTTTITTMTQVATSVVASRPLHPSPTSNSTRRRSDSEHQQQQQQQQQQQRSSRTQGNNERASSHHHATTTTTTTVPDDQANTATRQSSSEDVNGVGDDASMYSSSKSASSVIATPHATPNSSAGTGIDAATLNNNINTSRHSVFNFGDPGSPFSNGLVTHNSIGLTSMQTLVDRHSIGYAHGGHNRHGRAGTTVNGNTSHARSGTSINRAWLTNNNNNNNRNSTNFNNTNITGNENDSSLSSPTPTAHHDDNDKRQHEHEEDNMNDPTPRRRLPLAMSFLTHLLVASSSSSSSAAVPSQPPSTTGTEDEPTLPHPATQRAGPSAAIARSRTRFLAEAPQIVVVRDQGNNVTGLRVVPFAESPAAAARRNGGNGGAGVGGGGGGEAVG